MTCIQSPSIALNIIICLPSITPLILTHVHIHTPRVDFSKVKDFSMEGLRQEEIVNLGLKELVLAGFADAEDVRAKL